MADPMTIEKLPTSTSADKAFDEVDLQKTTTELRLDFLNILTKLEGKKAQFNLYKKNSSSSGVFRGSDRDILHFAVSEFESPTGVLNSAIVRTTDIDCMMIPVTLDKVSDKVECS